MYTDYRRNLVIATHIVLTVTRNKRVAMRWLYNIILSFTCLASDQSVCGQPDLGEVAFSDAPVDGIEPDGVRFAVHRPVSPVAGGVVPRLSYATLLRWTAIERPAAATIRDADGAALLLPPTARR